MYRCELNMAFYKCRVNLDITSTQYLKITRNDYPIVIYQKTKRIRVNIFLSSCIFVYWRVLQKDSTGYRSKEDYSWIWVKIQITNRRREWLRRSEKQEGEEGGWKLEGRNSKIPNISFILLSRKFTFATNIFKYSSQLHK